MDIYYSSFFHKQYKKLPPNERGKVKKKIELFQQDPYSPQLRTHKLQGKLDDHWAFSVTYSLRILFRFSHDGNIILVDVGSHSIYN